MAQNLIVVEALLVIPLANVYLLPWEADDLLLCAGLPGRDGLLILDAELFGNQILEALFRSE